MPRYTKQRKFTTLHGWVFDDRVDAKDTIVIGPLRRSDFKALPQNTMQCVLARAVNRQRKMINGRAVSAVWIGARVADVCFKDESGILYRYFLSPEDIKRVRTFDEHPGMVKEIGTWAHDIYITLIPPPRGRRLGDHPTTGKRRGNGGGKRRPALRHLFAEQKI